MAAEIDPESEALVRQLHRELNGLTRTSRRANPTYGVSFDAIATAKQQQHPAQREKETRSEGAAGLGKRPRADKERDRDRERERGRAAAGTSGSGSHRRRASPSHNSRQRQRRVRDVDDSEDAASEDDEDEDEDDDDADEEEEYESTRTSSSSESQSESEAQMRHKRHKGGGRDDRDGSRGDREVSRGDREVAAKQQRDRERERQRQREQERERERERERQRDRERDTKEHELEREREREREARAVGGAAGATVNAPQHRGSAAVRPEQGPARKADAAPGNPPVNQEAKEQERPRSQAAAVPTGIGAAGGLASAPGATAAEPESYRQPTQPTPQPPQPEVPLTPIEAAAAAASGAVKEQAKTCGQPNDPRMVKCFHAGVRWGIKLSRQALQTRSDLATALNDAFAGEILSCGRGEMLNIVFLDAQGTATEFPSLRGPNGRGKDSATKWRAMVERAVKIYVRRS